MLFYRICKADETSLDKILRTEEMLESFELLTSDLLYKIDPGHCYTLITDKLYGDLLQSKIFGEMSRSTYFVIQIRFNEDMITPKNRTMKALREAYKAGCRCYLIYLANGIQMNRFLKFIDRLVEKILCFIPWKNKKRRGKLLSKKKHEKKEEIVEKKLQNKKLEKNCKKKTKL